MSSTIPLAFFGGMPGGGELLLVFVVVLLLFGSKNLPSIARTLGRTLEEFRRAARDVTDEIMRAEKSVSDETKRLVEDTPVDPASTSTPPGARPQGNASSPGEEDEDAGGEEA